MAGQRNYSNRTSPSHRTLDHWRRVIGWGSSAGAALTFTIGPLAAVPAALLAAFQRVDSSHSCARGQIGANRRGQRT
jgi:hypothetical protein